MKDGITYKKLYANGLSSWGYGRSEYWEEYTYSYRDTLIEYGQIGLLRMDTPYRLLFLRTDSLASGHKYHQIINSFSTTEETVLHDFDVELGDILDFKHQAKVVQEIDSLEVADGKVVRRLWFNNQYGDPTYDYWLEGIGSIYGLFGAYTTNVNLLTGLPFGLPRITLYCFSSSNLNFPIPSNYYLRDSCLRNVAEYFDAFNAPRILINEERRKEQEEKEEQEEFDFQTTLDTLNITFRPNFMRRLQPAGIYFELGGIQKSADVERAIDAIHLFDYQGQHYGTLEGLKWRTISLGTQFQLSMLSPGYYLVVFELSNGRRIVKKLLLL